ncbi:MAG TPA: hypothetical protein VF865_21255 [Acidobacteriaceae bacterium]
MAKRVANSKRSGSTAIIVAGIGVAACSAICLMLAWPSTNVRASADVPQQDLSARHIVTTMLSNELTAAQHKDHYAYISRERSDRTGGHLWTEKVVESNAGKIRMLLEEDGKPLSPQRVAQERGRLAAIVADPTAFQKKSQTLKDDEAHARQLLTLLPNAFLFTEEREEGGYERIDFKPNPDYSPQSMEERVLHAMNGSMLVDAKAMRLREIEGRLPQDVSIGFGLLATIRAGSTFGTTRASFGQPDWKTTMLDTNINGKAIFFKSIAKREHAEHGDFVRVPNDLSVAQAVAIAEQP